MKLFLYLLMFNGVACTTVKVYICSGKTATRYHFFKGCRGLKNCDYQIEEITLEDALKQHKTQCRWE